MAVSHFAAGYHLARQPYIYGNFNRNTQTSKVCWINIRTGKAGSSLHGFQIHSYAEQESVYMSLAI